METKICSKCKIEKPIFEFCKNSRNKDGFAYCCKACEKQYRKDNAKHIIERRRQYYKNNSERILKQKKQYRKNNAEQISKQKKTIL